MICHADVVQDPEPSAPPFWEIITLHGVDSDQDNVRDNIEIWININFKDHNMNRALKKLATSYKNLKLLANDREKYRHGAVKHKLRTFCWKFVTLNLDGNHYEFLCELHNRFLNTPLRSYFFKEGFSNLPGGIVRIPDVMPHLFGVACEFEILNPRKIISEYLRKKPRYEWGDKQNKQFDELYESKSLTIDPFVLFHMGRRNP